LIFSLRLAALPQQAAQAGVGPLVTVRFSREEAQPASTPAGVLSHSALALPAHPAHSMPGAVAAVN